MLAPIVSDKYSVNSDVFKQITHQINPNDSLTHILITCKTFPKHTKAWHVYTDVFYFLQSKSLNSIQSMICIAKQTQGTHLPVFRILITLTAITVKSSTDLHTHTKIMTFTMCPCLWFVFAKYKFERPWDDMTGTVSRLPLLLARVLYFNIAQKKV